MKIADFCIKHKVTTILAFVMAVIFGVMSFGALPLALMPDIELPMAIVMTTYAGAGPVSYTHLDVYKRQVKYYRKYRGRGRKPGQKRWSL